MSEREAAITQPSQAEQTPAHTYTPTQQPSSKSPIPTPHTTVTPTSEPQTPHRSNSKISHTEVYRVLNYAMTLTTQHFQSVISQNSR